MSHRHMRFTFHVLAAASALAVFAAIGARAEAPSFDLIIKDHRFQPAELTIPADTKVKLVVKNEDASAEEFESHDFDREKIIKGKSQASLFVGPLKPGSYKFFGEFHPETAQGALIVK